MTALAQCAKSARERVCFAKVERPENAFDWARVWRRARESSIESPIEQRKLAEAMIK